MAIRTLLLGFLICSISVKTVVSQHINKLLQNQYEHKLNLVMDTTNNSHANYLGDFYQLKNENNKQKLKSAQLEASVQLLDSLKIYSYLSTDDSLLLYYNANYYNSKNQLIRKKIIHKLTFFTDFKYSYNQNNDTSLIEQIIYFNGEKQGEGKYIYKYNEENRIKSIEVHSIGYVEISPIRYLEDYSIDIHTNNIPPFTSIDSLTFKFIIRFDYTKDFQGRDSIARKRLFFPDGSGWHYNGSIFTNYEYYDNDTIKEKKIESQDNFGGLKDIFKYNNKGTLIHYEKSRIVLIKCEYDDSNTLRYMKRWEKYLNPGSNIDYKIWNIKDTLSNAHAVYIFEDFNDPQQPTLKDQKYLHLIFYNDNGLVSNTHMFIRDSANTGWETIYNDMIFYNDQNQISEYYLYVNNENIYQELYFYDNAGNKIRYEEYRKIMMNSYLSLNYKELYYYSNGNPTHIQEYGNLQNINLYPNPVNNSFTIENISDNRQFNYEIFNIYGKIFNSGIIQKTIEQIDISNYPPGIYYLKLFSKDNGKLAGVFKIVKL